MNLPRFKGLLSNNFTIEVDKSLKRPSLCVLKELKFTDIDYLIPLFRSYRVEEGVSLLSITGEESVILIPGWKFRAIFLYGTSMSLMSEQLLY